MFLENDRKGYMFNVGDSPSNNGWGKIDETILNFFYFVYIYFFKIMH